MTTATYRYAFAADVPVDEVGATLMLAVLAAEALHGEAQVLLDADSAWDPTRRVCVLDARTPVGVDLNKLFTAMAAREFGPAAFTVERVADKQRHAAEACS
jgi:hypothetical protein